MEETHKRKVQETDGERVVKRPRTQEVADGVVDDDGLAWLLMDKQDSEGELLSVSDLEKDAPEAASTVSRVRFIDNPYSSLLVFQSSSSYITINVNEESCGSSFSDSDTSMMASVDMSGLNVRGKLVSLETIGKWTAVERSAWISGDGATREEGSVSGDRMDGCDGFDWDDEVITRFLGEALFSKNL